MSQQEQHPDSSKFFKDPKRQLRFDKWFGMDNIASVLHGMAYKHPDLKKDALTEEIEIRQQIIREINQSQKPKNT